MPPHDAVIGTIGARFSNCLIDRVTKRFIPFGQADFFLLPTLSGYLQLAQAEGAGFEFFGPPEVAHGLGGTVHIALPKTDEALRDAVNQAIAEARADGTYHRIVRRHFPFSLE